MRRISRACGDSGGGVCIAGGKGCDVHEAHGMEMEIGALSRLVVLLAKYLRCDGRHRYIPYPDVPEA